MNLQPKAGFTLHTRSSPLTRPWEPIFVKQTDSAVILALRVDEPHLNSRGFAHGGLLACLADNAMGLSCAAALGGARLLTVNLTTDYISVARPGQWLEFVTTYLKCGRSLCFAQAFVRADDSVCARVNAVFQIAQPSPEKDKAHERRAAD
jgi:uncharacterized protein (TIGR00369 family)